MKIINFLVREKDIEGYAHLSGDFNPIHMNREFAVEHGFANKVAHGMLTMAKVWSVVSNELQLHHHPVQYDLTFQSPVYAGDRIDLMISQKNQTIIVTGKSQDKTVVKGTILMCEQGE